MNCALKWYFLVNSIAPCALHIIMDTFQIAKYNVPFVLAYGTIYIVHWHSMGIPSFMIASNIFFHLVSTILNCLLHWLCSNLQIKRSSHLTFTNVISIYGCFQLNWQGFFTLISHNDFEFCLLSLWEILSPRATLPYN